jgi:site-specific DNA-methyltransferase (adenine-specific)
VTPYYQDEAVTLYHGDCLDVLPALEMVDHVITDPPYARDVYLRLSQPNTKRGSGTPGRMSIPLTGKDGRKIHNLETGALARMSAGDIGAIDDLIVPVSALLAIILRRWCIVFSDAESCYLWRNALEPIGLRYVRTGAWVKPDAMPQMTGDRPGTGMELCTIAHAPGPMRWNGGGSLAVWTHFTAKGDGRPEGHPCPKPLPLMVELVTLFTDEGETILDPFAGSGTTGVAAKLNGRKCILIERDEKYCEVAAKRLQTTEPGRLFDKVAKAKPQSLLTEAGS